MDTPQQNFATPFQTHGALAVSFVGERPLTSVQPRVSGVMVRALADVVMQYGITPGALFQDLPDLTHSGEPVAARIALPDYHAYLRRAIELTNDPALGLRYGSLARVPSFDFLSPLVGHLPTLRAAISEIQHFGALGFEAAHVHLSEGDEVAKLTWEIPRIGEATDRVVEEFLAACILRLLHAFGATQGDLRSAWFQHEAPAHQQSYTELFGGLERFSQPSTGLEFGADVLDRPNLHASPMLHTLLRGRAEQYLARLSSQPIVERVRSYLRAHSAAQMPEMNTAARALGVSVRTLRRHLAEHSQSYRSLTQEAQSEWAMSLLQDKESTLKSIADTLGFADASAFHRAFKRWTGVTPSEYRSAL